MQTTTCYHCGDSCAKNPVIYDQKPFCCIGCKTVFAILKEHDLTAYYSFEESPGSSQIKAPSSYDFLESEDIVNRLISFKDTHITQVSLYIPNVHCSSCIWVLENLYKLNPGVVKSTVNFPKKTVRISFLHGQLPLQEVVVLLTRIGYAPYISLNDYEQKKKNHSRDLLYKIGIAGFAFGNIMFLSFPEYFDLLSLGRTGPDFWLEKYKTLFRWLMFALSIPVVVYAAQDYLISAYKGLRSRVLNLDVPITLGIITLFVRSTVDIALDLGSGFFDSLTGLVFFLLIGKYFQQKTYSFLNFERDYKSYFPIAVTRIEKNGAENSVQVYDVKKGDRLLIRNEEIIPTDAFILSGDATIDYSFVTGESKPVAKEIGDVVYAGGKQLRAALEVEALKPVSQSYLTQLWSDSAFQKNKSQQFRTLSDLIGKYFTYAVLSIATMAALFWLFYDSSYALNVFTAVLIIACPCALALAAPFTYGNILRIFGKLQLYLKDAQMIERLSKVDTIIFDKTGTLTSTLKNTLQYEGVALDPEESRLLKNTLRSSNHPLSRSLYTLLKEHEITTLDDYREHPGKGISGQLDGNTIKIGAGGFVDEPGTHAHEDTAVHVSTNNRYKGHFYFENHYREGIPEMIASLSDMPLAILSGDNDGERERLTNMLPSLTPIHFNQKPKDKLEFIKKLQSEGKTVMMVGDGLNDAGALAQSDVGIAIAEDVNVFSPGSDGILKGSKLKSLHHYVSASKKAVNIIRMSLVLSFLYNIIGLYFAVTGQLQPIVAAILMPLSSISIVAFTTVATSFIGRKLT